MTPMPLKTNGSMRLVQRDLIRGILCLVFAPQIQVILKGGASTGLADSLGGPVAHEASFNMRGTGREQAIDNRTFIKQPRDFEAHLMWFNEVGDPHFHKLRLTVG